MPISPRTTPFDIISTHISNVFESAFGLVSKSLILAIFNTLFVILIRSKNDTFSGLLTKCSSCFKPVMYIPILLLSLYSFSSRLYALSNSKNLRFFCFLFILYLIESRDVNNNFCLRIACSSLNLFTISTVFSLSQ